MDGSKDGREKGQGFEQKEVAVNVHTLLIFVTTSQKMTTFSEAVLSSFSSVGGAIVSNMST